jgi:acyl carrier protein
VREAVVVAVLAEVEEGTVRLGAFVVADPLPDLAVELRRFLSRTLPDYMVPSAFVPLDSLPLTRSGKVDRRALPALSVLPDSVLARAAAAEFVPPSTPVEELLAEVFAEVLGIEKGRIGVHDNFFDLGGHSLLGNRVVVILYDRWGLEVPLRALFEATDLEDLANRIVETELLAAPDDVVDELLADLGS